MKKLFIVFWTLFAFINTKAQNIIDISMLEQINLPLIVIETVNGEEPTFDKVEPPVGSFGHSITNATKVPGRITITRLGKTLYDSGDYIKDKSGMTIKVRGNTSAWHDKHPYKIKLQKKADLLCRGDDSKYKDKNWVLLNKAYNINTMAASKMCRLTNIQWVPSSQFVNLVFNNEYQGVYTLIESVEYNEKCRLNVSKTEGYIIEMDAYWWNENMYFDTNKTDLTKKYTFKYPDEDDVTPEQIEYIQSYIKDAEDAIDNGVYDNFIDVSSFATWVLLHDMLGTWDSGGSNIFLTKKDNQSKLEMGNLWDFDSVFMMDNDWASVHHDFFYYDDLFNNKNKLFVKEYVKQWNDVKNTIFDEVINYMNEFMYSDEGEALDQSLMLEQNRWGHETTKVADQISHMEGYFLKHKDWLENAINKLNDLSGISPVKNNSLNTAIYDLNGRRASINTKGPLIQGGVVIIK